MLCFLFQYFFICYWKIKYILCKGFRSFYIYDNIYTTMEILDIKKSQKVVKRFYCKKCDYVCSRKYDYNKHNLTRKHQTAINGNGGNETVVDKLFPEASSPISSTKEAGSSTPMPITPRGR